MITRPRDVGSVDTLTNPWWLCLFKTCHRHQHYRTRAWAQTLFDVLSPKDHGFLWVLEEPGKLRIPFFGQRYVEIAHDFASGVTEMEHHNHRGIPYGILKGDCLLTGKKTKQHHITRKRTRNEEVIQVWKWQTFTRNWLKDMLALKNATYYIPLFFVVPFVFIIFLTLFCLSKHRQKSQLLHFLKYKTPIPKVSEWHRHPLPYEWCVARVLPLEDQSALHGALLWIHPNPRPHDLKHEDMQHC